MPLFGSYRDSGLVLSVNRELLHGIISNEVAIYKLNLEHTQVNIYEESEQRSYDPPVRAYSLVQLDPPMAETGEAGLSFTRTATFSILKTDLIDSDLVMLEGDIIEYDNTYYEVDQVVDTIYWTGRNPSTVIGMTQDNWPVHGYDVSVTVTCHLTSTNTLHIVDRRMGNVKPAVDLSNSVPKFL
jgi:hypothetical protein